MSGTANLINKADLIKAIRDATVYRSPIPGNWWNGRPRELDRDEIIGIIKEQPEYVPIGCREEKSWPQR